MPDILAGLPLNAAGPQAPAGPAQQQSSTSAPQVPLQAPPAPMVAPPHTPNPWPNPNAEPFKPNASPSAPTSQPTEPIGYAPRSYVFSLGRQISPMEVDHLRFPIGQFAGNYVGNYDPNRLYTIADINQVENASGGVNLAGATGGATIRPKSSACDPCWMCGATTHWNFSCFIIYENYFLFHAYFIHYWPLIFYLFIFCASFILFA